MIMYFTIRDIPKEIRWQPNQIIAIRDKVAFVRVGFKIVPFFRVDHSTGQSEWTFNRHLHYQSLKMAIRALLRQNYQNSFLQDLG